MKYIKIALLSALVLNFAGNANAVDYGQKLADYQTSIKAMDCYYSSGSGCSAYGYTLTEAREVANSLVNTEFPSLYYTSKKALDEESNKFLLKILKQEVEEFSLRLNIQTVANYNQILHDDVIFKSVISAPNFEILNPKDRAAAGYDSFTLEQNKAETLEFLTEFNNQSTEELPYYLQAHSSDAVSESTNIVLENGSTVAIAYKEVLNTGPSGFTETVSGTTTMKRDPEDGYNIKIYASESTISVTGNGFVFDPDNIPALGSGSGTKWSGLTKNYDYKTSGLPSNKEQTAEEAAATVAKYELAQKQVVIVVAIMEVESKMDLLASASDKTVAKQEITEAMRKLEENISVLNGLDDKKSVSYKERYYNLKLRYNSL